MSPEYERLRDEALALPYEERRELAYELLRSLDEEALQRVCDRLAELRS